jgi:hypothetical protein
MVPNEPEPQKGGIAAKPKDAGTTRYSGRGAAQSNSGTFNGQGDPRGEDAVNRPYEGDELENEAERAAVDGAEPAEDDFDDEDDGHEAKPTDQEFLQMVAEATSQAAFYSNQINRRAWERAYKAYRQEHFHGSKYTQPDFRNRSRLFIPKTRSAVRKDLAATSASMFGTSDPIECSAGNEGDLKQRGGAAVIKELISYRTDGANGKAAMPWFETALGARQTSLFTGFCVTKQFWKLDLRRAGTEDFDDEETGEKRTRDVWVPHIDRPESMLIAPENCTIDPACDWTNPAQDSAYFIIKYPMRINEIRQMQRDPRRPWKKVSDQELRAAGEGAKMEAASIRRARDQGLDRFDQSANSGTFDVIWVYETFIRTAGEDWQFWSIGDKTMLTDPAPVAEVYPEQDGERPITMGYGSFEAFCVFPQAAVESWQMLQQEANDVRNLTLDSFKQNVMPVTKVLRGRQIDLDQLKRRGQGTSIMVTNKDDVTWEKPPDVPASAQAIKQQLDIDFDDLAGQQNYGTVQDNNALGKTLGGLKLAAGAANAVQEFDLRVFIETWASKAVRQLVKLEQFYESDPIVLGVCGDKAKLFEKHGINEITDELLESNVTVRVSVGLGAGDPQQVLQKFQAAATVALPLLAMDPRFKSGELQIDGEAVMAEAFGRGAGFRDGGQRFIKKGEPMGPDPAAQAAVAAEGEEKKASAGLKQAQAKAAILNAISNAAKVGIDLHKMGIDTKKMEFDQSIAHMDQLGRAVEMGQNHGLAMQAAQMAAKGLNVDGTPIDMPGTEPGADYPDGKVPPEVLGDVPGGAPAPAPAAPQDPSAAAPPTGGPPNLNDLTAPPADKPAASAEPAAPAAKKKRTVRITGRDPATNRANAFEIED